MRLEFLIRRVFLLFIIIWAAASLNFMIPRLSGGDPIRSRLLQTAATGGAVQTGMNEMVEIYQEKFGLNDPLQEQYITYLQQVFTGDLGYSMANYPATVWDVMGSAIPWTIGLLFTTTTSCLCSRHARRRFTGLAQITSLHSLHLSTSAHLFRNSVFSARSHPALRLRLQFPLVPAFWWIYARSLSRLESRLC